MNAEHSRRRQRGQINWENLCVDLIDNHEEYHQHFYSCNKFTGPSQYFHLRALAASEADKCEIIYALLVSWRMHRMGGGAEMNDYHVFSSSLTPLFRQLSFLRERTLETVSGSEMVKLQPIFEDLTPTRTSRKIVAVSKILAHYIPDIIAPIDNEYTFQFISETPGKTTPPRNWTEFELFKEIHLKLFKKVVSDESFKASASQWLSSKKFHWDTSLPKIVDNLIIGKIGHLKKIDRLYSKKK